MFYFPRPCHAERAAYSDRPSSVKTLTFLRGAREASEAADRSGCQRCFARTNQDASAVSRSISLRGGRRAQHDTRGGVFYGMPLPVSFVKMHYRVPTITTT